MRVIIFIFIISLIINLNAADEWNRIIDLRGHWKFEIGDNPVWANSNYDDSKWHEIFVPSPWEDEGYPGYDGYAWYRIKFEIPAKYKDKAIYLRLGRVDDVDEVYLNGRFVAFSGQFPPEYATAYTFERQYFIPTEYFNFDKSNVLAVRIFDESMVGGIVDGKVGLYELTSYLYPDINLNGTWKFQIGDDMEWKDPSYYDLNWNTVHVPSYWETQGYQEYNGYAWYRKKFTISSKFNEGKLILLMGKIDDVDEVYLNGHRIGKTGKIYDNPDRIDLDDYYLEYRAYFIPEEYLNFDKENTLAVRVYDGMFHGGIYDGPVGIVSQEEYLVWQKNYQKSNEKKFRSIFDILFPNKN